MQWLTRTLRDPFGDDDEILRRARYGVIEVRDGHLVAVHVRRWPKVISVLEVQWLDQRVHARRPGDRLLVYYNQPRRYPNFLALTYVLSQRGCTLATLRCARTVLDQIARVKRSDAILCDVWNARISAPLLARWGWEPHKPQRWHRHYIKRFYGVYSPPGECPAARECLAADVASSEPETALVNR